MRRSFAGLLLGLAVACAGLAISGWLLQRSAFNPQRTKDLAGVVLADEELRNQLTETIVNSAARLPIERTVLQSNVETVMAVPAGQELVGEILFDAHERLIGRTDEPVQISSPQLVEIIRDQRASTLPALTLSVPTVGVLGVVDDVLKWLVPVSGGVSFVLMALAFVAHPEPGEVTRSVAFGLLFLGALAAVLGYVIPRFVVPLLVSNAWEAIPVRLADDSRNRLIALEAVLVAASLLLMGGSSVTQRRRRFNAPVSTYRYSEERRWS
jgi:hypothetical protein